jgi:hypothetical protein
VLAFFSWVGMYPGGSGAFTQNAWQAAFGGGSLDPVWVKATAGQSILIVRPDQVGASGLLIVFLLVLVLLLLLTGGILALDLKLLPLSLPPGAQALLPWRWALVAGLGFLALFFLLLQLLVGFTLERTIAADCVNAVKAVQSVTTAEDQEVFDFKVGILEGMFGLKRTLWLRLAVLLNILIVLGAAGACWMERRGNRPPPRFECAW